MEDKYEPYLDQDTRTRMAQYKNLRTHFYILLEMIFGKDYWNDGCDVYMCDQLACEDILREYVDKKFDASFYHLAMLLSLFVNLAFASYFIFF